MIPGGANSIFGIPGGANSIFGGLMRKYDEALLSIPRRMTRRALLLDHALGLTGLSLAVRQCCA